MELGSRGRVQVTEGVPQASRLLEKWLDDTKASIRARQGPAEPRAAEPLIFNAGLGPLF